MRISLGYRLSFSARLPRRADGILLSSGETAKLSVLSLHGLSTPDVCVQRGKEYSLLICCQQIFCD